jgi:serine/threonine protein kinase
MEFKVGNPNIYDQDERESIKSLSSTMSNEENLRILEQLGEKPKHKPSIKDFEIVNVLGRGSYAKVLLGRNYYTGEVRAIKAIDKAFLEKVKKN